MSDIRSAGSAHNNNGSGRVNRRKGDAAPETENVQRAILPIPDVRQRMTPAYDARDPETKFPPITPLRPPAGAPNVLVVLLDDVGFGASSAFGGPCQDSDS